MPWESGPAKQTQAGILSNQYPFVWLFDVGVPSDPRTRVRVASYTEAVVFGQDTSGNDLTYDPFGFSVTGLAEDSEGNLPTLTISVSNKTREVQALIETYNGLIGESANLQLVNVTALQAGAFLRYTGEVVKVSSDESVASVEIGSYNLERQLLPSNRALRDFCGFQYKGNRCGYTGALPDCDKTLNGPNGCVFHANQDRFGGFPSIPKPGNL